MLKKNIIMENKLVIFRALDFYRELSVNFVDSYVYSHCYKNKVNKVFSFDEHFKRFEDLEITT